MLTFRNASPSYWACLLLPAAIYFADIKFQGQSFIALSIMLINTTLLILVDALQFHVVALLRGLKKMNLVLGCLTMTYCYLIGGNFYEFSSYAVLNFTFPYIFYDLIKLNPRSFTFAEGIIVTSAFSYNFWLSSQNIPFPPKSLPQAYEDEIIAIFVQLLFFSGVLAARFILLTVQPWKLYELEELYCLWAKCCLIAFSYRLPDATNSIWFLVQWPFDFLFGTSERIILLIYWAICVVFAVGFVAFKNFNGNLATSTDRKYFHFLIVAVYLPGVLKDFDLIYFCSNVVLFVFVIIEVVRILKFEILGLKIGEFIDNQVQIYRDHQDEGNLILTPIYLLAGCSLPIWLTGLYSRDGVVLEPIEVMAALSGVFSIGIGDTFSSIGGTLYGKTKWAGSKKTLEGTACSIAAQFGVLIFLNMFGLVPYTLICFVGQILSIVINALSEATTDQIDNLIVPLVAFNTIHLFKYVVDSLRYAF